jgi:hypothetical protein
MRWVLYIYDFQVKGKSEAKFGISTHIYNYVIDHVS